MHLGDPVTAPESQIAEHLDADPDTLRELAAVWVAAGRPSLAGCWFSSPETFKAWCAEGDREPSWMRWGDE